MADAISKLPTANKDENEPRTEVQRLNEMFTNNEAYKLLAENNESFPLHLLQVREAQQKELNTNNSKLKQVLTRTKNSRYVLNDLEGVELIFYENRIYVPKALRERTITLF